MNGRQKSLLVCNLLVVALIGSSALGARIAGATPQTWIIVSTPNASTNNNYLLGVAAIKENDAWAVGWYHSSGGSPAEQTLTEHWNGTSWSIVASPNVGTGNNAFYADSVTPGASAQTGGSLWAVGYSTDSNQYTRTLAMRYNVCTRCAPPPP